MPRAAGGPTRLLAWGSSAAAEDPPLARANIYYTFDVVLIGEI